MIYFIDIVIIEGILITDEYDVIFLLLETIHDGFLRRTLKKKKIYIY